MHRLQDSHAIPRIEEITDNLRGAKHFSTLDMRSGFYQVEMEESHKPRTAFTVGPLGFYQFERMPFGLSNSPATFQRLMERAMGDLHMRECFTFIDDTIVHGDSFEQHLERLEHVFEKVRQGNLKLNPDKCTFFKLRIKFCGHVVSEAGVETDPDKTVRISEWPIPESAEQLREFLGFAGYYRRFVKGFSAIAKPLSQLLSGCQRKKGKGKNKSMGEVPEWRWTQEQQSAFEHLKKCLTTPPVLGYPDYTRPFTLHTDASGDGLGAVLCQEQEGHEKVIAYASRGLSRSEKNYPAHKLEYLALKWAVTDKFSDYLYGNKFTVLTDNNPLTYILTSAKLDATGHRWLAALAAYDFDIKYRPGIHNADADALSRLPKRLPGEADYQVVTRETIASLCKAQMFSGPAAEALCLSADVLDAEEFDVDITMNPRQMRVAQRNDPVLGALYPYVSQKVKPKSCRLPNNPEMRALLKEFDNLTMKRGVMHRSTTVQDKERLQIVLPSEYRPLALKGLHDDIGHLGRDKTLQLVRDRYYWPKMTADVESKVKGCDRCIRRKTPTNIHAPMVNIVTTQPLELVCMDYLTLEPSKGGFENVLVITDHFTRYAQAYPTRNQTAKTTAEVFFNHFVVHYGLPQRIHSDQGANFQSRLMKELCELVGIAKSRTTPAHAMGNGMCERFNRTLLNMLGTLDTEAKRDWKAHIPLLVHAYNASRHESTGFSPFHLMFGREPRLPINLVLGVEAEDEEEKSHTQYVTELKKKLRDAYNMANREAERSRGKQKANYDKRVRAGVLELGDRVLVKVLHFEGKHKIADKWGMDVYVISEQPNLDIPVYVVQPEEGGPTKHLHRNNMLPIGSLPLPLVKTDLGRKDSQTPSSSVSESSSEDEDDEDCGGLVVTLAEPGAAADSLVQEESLLTDKKTVDELEGRPESLDNSLEQGQEDESESDDEVSEFEVSESEDESTTENSEEELDEELGAAEDAESECSSQEDRDFPVSSQSHIEVEVKAPQPMPRGPMPVPQPRQSLRNRRPPEWQRSGDFVMYRCQDAVGNVSQGPVTLGWAEKAQFLAELAKQPTFTHMSNSVCETILQIVAQT